MGEVLNLRRRQSVSICRGIPQLPSAAVAGPRPKPGMAAQPRCPMGIPGTRPLRPPVLPLGCMLAGGGREEPGLGLNPGANVSVCASSGIVRLNAHPQRELEY